MKKTVYLLLILTCLAHITSAQLSFPKGSTLDLTTTSSTLYLETRIIFYTGSYKVTDYDWSRAFIDSLDPTWEFQACMNGDCKIGLPGSGVFITDFGINDTTGFIAFHVYTGKQSGRSTLKYYVRNNLNDNDNALLTFNINYEKTTGLSEASKDQHQLLIYPNPSSDYISIKTDHTSIREGIRIYNLMNQLVYDEAPQSLNEHIIPVHQLPEGLYQLVAGDYHQTFAVKH